MNGSSWALVTACIWGIVPLMEKMGLGAQVSATTGVLVRSIGVIFGSLIGWILWSPAALIQNLGLPSFFLLAGGGFLASFIGQLAFYRALQLGTVSQVTPIAGAYPLVASLFSFWFLHEPLTWTRASGAVLIVCGVMLLQK